MSECVPPRLVAFVMTRVRSRHAAPRRRRRRRTRGARRSPDSGRSARPGAPPACARARAAVSVCRSTRNGERPQAAEQEPARVRRGDDPERAAELCESRGALFVAGDDDAEQDVVVAREVLRRAVEHEVGAVLQRAEVHRRGDGRVDDDGRRRARRRPRGRASSGTGSTAPRARRAATPSGGGPVWSNSTTFTPQRSSAAKSRPVPKYAPAASAIVVPGSSSASASAVVAPAPDGNSSACPPSSSPSACSAATPVGCRSAGSRSRPPRRARRTARSSSGRGSRGQLYFQPWPGSDTSDVPNRGAAARLPGGKPRARRPSARPVRAVAG